MTLDHVLLGLLAVRPRSGYDLQQWLEKEGGFLRSNIHRSQVYRTLNRMADTGWVAFALDPRDKRPDAKVYRLTEAGRAELLRWARAPYRPTSRFQDPDFMARFVFTGMVDTEALLDVVDTELAYRRAQVAASRGRDRSMHFEDSIPEIDEGRARLFHELAHQQGAGAVDAWIDWLERTRRLLQDAPLADGGAR
ncbi:PadR family transcriptional regulator [Streptomyces sp. CA-132043]|uniref:PadR family transcriptional regulator n=1 Tax=Streptomyces sp. CA-132043 TaxID=3240048 RepID=UPI003D8ABC11